MKALKKPIIKLTVLFLSIQIISLSNLFAQVDTSTVKDEVNVTFQADKYEIVKEANGELIKINGFNKSTSPGDPVLPQKIYDIVVPPNIDWKSIQIEFVPVDKPVEGKHDILPAPPLRARVGDEELIDWGIGKNIVEGKNVNIYGNNKFYPASPVNITSQSQMRKWKFVRVVFNPIQYNPVTGELKYVSSVNVKIRFRKYASRAFINDTIMRDKIMDTEARQRFYNIGRQTDTWYGPLGGGALPTQYDYVIITTNAIVSGSGTGLTDFINHKTNMGHSVLVVTESDYGPLTGQAPNGTAEKIRQWLKDNYIVKGIKWVLLIGNPDPDDPLDASDAVGDIPMKMCWPNRVYYTYRESPTDHFFAELTAGNWDLDGDGFYGEPIEITNPTLPDPMISSTSFSIRWTGQIQYDLAGTYYFAMSSDEGMRLIIDGTTIINAFTAHNNPITNYGSTNLSVGMHNITIEYFNTNGEGTAGLWWFKRLCDNRQFIFNLISFLSLISSP